MAKLNLAFDDVIRTFNFVSAVLAAEMNIKDKYYINLKTIDPMVDELCNIKKIINLSEDDTLDYSNVYYCMANDNTKIIIASVKGSYESFKDYVFKEYVNSNSANLLVEPVFKDGYDKLYLIIDTDIFEEPDKLIEYVQFLFKVIIDSFSINGADNSALISLLSHILVNYPIDDSEPFTFEEVNSFISNNCNITDNIIINSCAYTRATMLKMLS